MNIRSISRPEIISVDVWESLAEAASRMQFNEVGSLVVFDGRRFVGILTERDLVRALGDGAPPARTPVRDYMTEEPLVISPDAEVGEAVRMMLGLSVRHLPVVEGDQVVGMVSARDLLAQEDITVTVEHATAAPRTRRGASR